jgi:sugar lactone lactonase YvrE
MMMKDLSAGVLLLLALGAGPAWAQPAAPDFPGAPSIAAGNYGISKRSAVDLALPDRYQRDELFFRWPAGRTLGAISAIDMDRDGRSIWVAERCGGQSHCIGKSVDPVLKFDANGKVVRQFGAGMIVYPHGIFVDHDNNVWVTDLQSNVDRPAPRPGQPPEVVPGLKPNGAQVVKFSPEGKRLLTLGVPGVYGNDATHLSQPSDVLVTKSGTIFVADAHDSAPSNHRIVKYDRTGKFIKAWDACGSAPVPGANKIDCAHALAMDSQGRLFVANRGSSRIEIFDQEGKLLDEWYQFGKPSGMAIDAEDRLYAVDTQSGVREGNAFVRGMHVGSARTGEVMSFTPDPLGNPAPWFPLRGTTGSEGVTVGPDGTVYTSQVTPPGLVRYVPKPD